MKIVLCILWIASNSLALPAPERKLFKKEVAPGSENGSNLLDATAKNISGSDLGSSISTDSSKNEGKKNLQSEQNAKDTSTTLNAESRSFLGQISDAALHSDEFKIRILDLDHPAIPEFGKSAGAYLNPVIHQDGLNVIKVPEVYVLKVPHVVLVKESDFLSGNHHAIPTIIGPFIPFQGIPSPNPSIFEIPSIIPAYPIEAPQAVPQFPIISAGSEIPVIPEIGGIHQGIDILKPEIISAIEPVAPTGEAVDHENDSVTVEAFEKQEASVKEVVSGTKASEEHAAEKSKEKAEN